MTSINVKALLVSTYTSTGHCTFSYCTKLVPELLYLPKYKIGLSSTLALNVVVIWNSYTKHQLKQIVCCGYSLFIMQVNNSRMDQTKSCCQMLIPLNHTKKMNTCNAAYFFYYHTSLYVSVNKMMERYNENSKLQNKITDVSGNC
jgi:hypothetical protein